MPRRSVVTTRIAPVKIALAMVFVGIALPGCASRQKAVDTINAIQTTRAQVEAAHRKFTLELTTQYLGAVKARLRAEAEVLKERVRAEIFSKADKKMSGTFESASNQLDISMDDTIKTLREDLDAEKDKRSRGTGDRAKELELAVQLAATLAVTEKERGKFASRTRDRFVAKREEAIAELNAKFDELLKHSAFDFDPEVEAKAVLDTYFKQNAAYDSKVDFGLNELTRYVNSLKLGMQSFFTGAIGDGLTKFAISATDSPLRAGLSRIANTYIDKANDEIDSFEESALKKADDLIDLID